MADNEIILHCPRCEHHAVPKLYINIDKGVFNCFRCDFSGPIKLLYKYPKVIEKLQDILDSTSKNKLHSFKPLEVSTFDLLDFLNPVREIFYTDPHYDYLLGRGWTEDHIFNYRPMRSMNPKFADRVIIPIFDDQEKLIYFTARSINSESTLRYINAKVSKSNILFKSILQENYFYKSIGVICEGVFDSFKIPNAIGLLGKILTKENEKNLLEFIKDKQKIYVCLDKGAEKNIETLCHKLAVWSPNKTIYYIKTMAYGDNDLGDLSKEMSSHQLIQFIIQNSLEYKELDMLDNIKRKLSLCCLNRN